jgi:fused signal recognition particle receptor
MNLFWKRKKQDDAEGGTPKQSFISRLFGREPQPEPPDVESLPPAAVEPSPVEAATPALPPTETPALEIAPAAPPPPPLHFPPTIPVEPVMPPPPAPAPEISEEKPEKAGFFSRFFGRGEAAPTEPEPTEPAPAAPVVALEPAAAPDDASERRFFLRMKRAVSRTKQNLVGRLDTLVRGKKTISPDVLDELEEILIGSDIGVQTTLELVEKIRTQVSRKLINDTDELKRLLKDELLLLLKTPTHSLSGRAVASELDLSPDIRPYVMMMVGVNGVGKTTTIAKLANLIKREGNEVMVCAADTFRAAAADQLAVWAERVGIPLIQQKPGTDPAAVVYDSLTAAKARNTDVIIIDTAGRLHNKVNLMQELEKMSRIAGREVPQAPHEVLLVLDAATGQNGLEQARQFVKTVPVTGVVLTKLDGTAKGGIVVAIARELGIPIRYIGTGEQIDDLAVFSPDDFVNGLFE